MWLFRTPLSTHDYRLRRCRSQLDGVQGRFLPIRRRVHVHNGWKLRLTRHLCWAVLAAVLHRRVPMQVRRRAVSPTVTSRATMDRWSCGAARLAPTRRHACRLHPFSRALVSTAAACRSAKTSRCLRRKQTGQLMGLVVKTWQRQLRAQRSRLRQHSTVSGRVGLSLAGKSCALLITFEVHLL